MPISATLSSREIVKRAYGTMERYDLHGSTFAGNALCCAAALMALRVLREEELAGRAAVMGARLIELLRERLRGHPLVREVRGRGLLVGIELGPTERGLLQRIAPGVVSALARGVLGQWLSVRLLEQGLVAQPASQQWNVLKLTPPLLVEEAHLTRVVSAIGEIMDQYRELGPLLRDVAVRLGSQWKDGWGFK